MLGLALPLGRGHFLELPLSHRLIHRPGGAFKFPNLFRATLCRKSGESWLCFEAPAAICWALDFTGMIGLILRVYATQGLPSRQGAIAVFTLDSRDNIYRAGWPLRARGMRLA
jgi:hypothetical protein